MRTVQAQLGMTVLWWSHSSTTQPPHWAGYSLQNNNIHGLEPAVSADVGCEGYN